MTASGQRFMGTLAREDRLKRKYAQNVWLLLRLARYTYKRGVYRREMRGTVSVGAHTRIKERGTRRPVLHIRYDSFLAAYCVLKHTLTMTAR
ncbi:hypothetical protein NDU88_003639 [Pleurodeles waltl]|uniref:Uncharacterized protein n=1 Tax=Pleurodeles waltl TaxID=8319 RepID=A0AAV7WPN2_PLEWA|nr:hypothetical protein NDU88_003639 [Pleurodeles waltl]